MGRHSALLELHIRVGYVLHTWLLKCINITSFVYSVDEVTILWTAMQDHNRHSEHSMAISIYML